MTGPAHTPPTFHSGRVTGFQLWCPITGSEEGRRLLELGAGSVAGAGLFRGAHDFSLRVSVFPRCSVLCQLPLGWLGPKSISVLWLDGFSSSSCLVFEVFRGLAKLRALFFTTQKGLSIRLSRVPIFPISGYPPSP